MGWGTWQGGICWLRGDQTGPGRTGKLGHSVASRHGVWVDQWGKACQASPDETGQGFTASLWLTEGQVHRPWVRPSRVWEEGPLQEVLSRM